MYYNYIHNNMHNLYLGKLCDIDKILVWNNTIIYIEIFILFVSYTENISGNRTSSNL